MMEHKTALLLILALMCLAHTLEYNDLLVSEQIAAERNAVTVAQR